MAPVAVVVLASFSPAQLQSRTQIVFAPRVCTLVLFIPHFIALSIAKDNKWFFRLVWFRDYVMQFGLAVGCCKFVRKFT